MLPNKPLLLTAFIACVHAGPLANPGPQYSLRSGYGLVKNQINFQSSDSVYQAAPEVFVDQLIAGAEEQGGKIVKVLRTLQGKQIVSRALAALANAEDPCAVIPSNLDATVEGLVDGLRSSRAQLVDMVAIVQQLKKYEDDTAKSISYAADAMASSAALIPYFSSIIRVNPQCQSTMEAATNTASGFGIAIDALNQANAFGNDATTTSYINRISQASKAITRVTNDLQEVQFDSLCTNSPTFNAQAFEGVSTLLGGLKDVLAAFNADQSSADFSSLEETIRTLREAAELIRSLNLSQLTGVVPSESTVYSTAPGECSTSITDISTTLDDVAQVIQAFIPQSAPVVV